MRILESQNAVLSNYEVYDHLIDSQKRFSARHRKEHRRPPQNYRTITKDVIQYFETHPSPLSQDPITYNEDSIKTLMERLKEFGLTKGEMLMIVNLRPTDGPALNVCIDEFEGRFSREQRTRMRDIVIEVLGAFPEETVEETVEETQAGDAEADADAEPAQESIEDAA